MQPGVIPITHTSRPSSIFAFCIEDIAMRGGISGEDTQLHRYYSESKKNNPPDDDS
jgi:hypothetical protein